MQRVVVAVVVAGLLALGIALARQRDPWRTRPATLLLLDDGASRVEADVAVLAEGLTRLGMSDYCAGPIELRITTTRALPAELILTLGVRGHGPGTGLTVVAGGATSSLAHLHGLSELVGVPLAAPRAEVRLALDGTGWLRIESAAFGDHPSDRPRLHSVCSPVRQVAGGGVALGAGWLTFTDPRMHAAPPGPQVTESFGFLRLEPERPGPHTLLVPWRSDLDGGEPRFTLDGVAIAAQPGPGPARMAVLPCELRAGSVLAIASANARADRIPAAGIVVDLPGIRLERRD